MMDVATWAREYFGKSLSLNTVRRCRHKSISKLYYAKRKAFINFSQKHRRVLGPEVIWDGPKDSGNVFSGQTSPHFSLFFEKADIGFYIPKMKKTIQTMLPTKSAKTNLSDGMGVSQSLQHGWSAYVKVPLMWRDMLEFWRDICCCQDDDFSQELHVYFSRIMPRLLLHKLAP